jgi:formylglycine-generating enzyme required for sulfatase activity
MAHDIFISYAEEDKAVAESVCHALEEKAICCWYAPRDVPYTADYEEAIIDAISESRLLLLILSSHSNNSIHVKREIQNACREEPPIPVLPFQIEDVTLNKALRYYIGSVQWLSALTPPLEDHLQKLVEYMQTYLAQEKSSVEEGVSQSTPAALSLLDEETRPSDESEEAARLQAVEDERRRAEDKRQHQEEALSHESNPDAKQETLDVSPAEIVDEDVSMTVFLRGLLKLLARATWPMIVAAALITLAIVAIAAVIWLTQSNRTTSGNTNQSATAQPSPSQASQPPGAMVQDSIGMLFVYLPPGTFMMGSLENEKERDKDEGPQHLVNIQSFYMGKYEVTQAQWRAVMGNNPSRFSGCDDCPVENVSWNGTQDFIRRLNSIQSQYTYRLPSEAEWEYACRAGTTTAFAFGDSLSSEQANFDGNHPYGAGAKGIYRGKTTSVGSFPPNAFGLEDMHGNVDEWCQDIYHDSYNGAPSDGSAWLTGVDTDSRAARGGSWYSSGVTLRSASRFGSTLNIRGIIGLRLVAVARR